MSSGRLLSLRRAFASAATSARPAVTPTAGLRVIDGDIRNGFAGAVGNTPLIRLRKLSEETGCEVLGKAEWLQPGGSIKDRAALWLVKSAEESGALRPGGTVVEGTAGNTGIGLAHVCNARGYRLIIYMPDTQSQEKIDLLRLLGAEVRCVPAVPVTDPSHYTFQARDAAAKCGGVWTNQFDNPQNAAAHEATTGPEIWAQTRGAVDAFTCATGTGGTLAGTAAALKRVSGGRVRIVLADPPGSVLHSFISSGGTRLERSGSSITEGIGQGRVTDNLRPALPLIDSSVRIEDARTVAMIFRLLKDEVGFLWLVYSPRYMRVPHLQLETHCNANVVVIIPNIRPSTTGHLRGCVVRAECRCGRRRGERTRARQDGRHRHLRRGLPLPNPTLFAQVA